MKTPECEKLSEVSKESQSIGEFLDWLQSEKNIVLGEWVEDKYADDGEKIIQVNISIGHLLALYFNINLNKVEEERRAILNDIRKKNEEKNK